MEQYDYLIVGSGLAGVSAIKGIRAEDDSGTILLVGEEEELPYNRPPLTKDLLLGDKTVEEVQLEGESFYRENDVEVKLGTEAVGINVDEKEVEDENGNSYGYGELLLATGGYPNKLSIPGGDLPGIHYYRYLDDYRDLREEMQGAEKAIVIGGGFIGSELAAALNQNDLDAFMLFPEKYLLQKVFPVELAGIIQEDYRSRGVEILSEDKPKKIEPDEGGYRVESSAGETIEGDIVVVGIGISPAVELAEDAGLEVFDGIGVDEYLRTTAPNVYAAGDVAYFPSVASQDCARIEHWDHAIKQGKKAGANMAGRHEPYDYIPYFFSDLFDYGFEAVGQVDSSLDTFIDWTEEARKGAVYYLTEEGNVRGVLLLGLWGKKKAARELIREERTYKKEDLVGRIG